VVGVGEQAILVGDVQIPQEYFPNKQALLVALAERHVDLAELEIRAVIARDGSTPDLLSGLQQAIVESNTIL